MKQIILGLIILFSPLYLFAQFDFSLEAVRLNDERLNSGATMAICDVNDDGLDDLIALDNARVPYVSYQTVGQKSSYVVTLEEVANRRHWSMLVADVTDAPGLEIFVFGAAGLYMLEAEGPFGPFTKTRIPSDNFLTQSASMADMDDDGDLDIFLCDDDDVNFIALNQGNGIFVETDGVMDFTTNPTSDQSGNYGSMFSDFDRDGDLDFYLSKCRGGAQPGDVRRTNQFFIKSPGGYEQSDAFPNLLSNAQSWAAEFIDVDNDADWDLLIVNHDAPMELYIQDENGNFTNDAEARGLNDFWGIIQIVSADFDNDGDVDLFIPGNEYHFYENDGTGHFTEVKPVFANTSIGSATCGDLNNDGRMDIYSSVMKIYNNPVAASDQLLWNTTDNENHFIKFKLKSNNPDNINAIGATVEIYIDGVSQIREVRMGESYGIVKSNTLHFGIGEELRIDSFHVHWPGGTMESFGPALFNRTHLVREGGMVMALSQLEVRSSHDVLCAGDTIYLQSPPASEYRWNTGSTDSVIAVHEPGVYQVAIQRNGQWSNLNAYQVISAPETKPEIVTDRLVKCQGEALMLHAATPYPGDVNWNNLFFGQSLMVSDPGEYFYRFSGDCGVQYSDTINIMDNIVMSPIYENDTVMRNERARLFSTDASTVWTDDTTSQIILGQGNFFFIDSLMADSVLFARRQDTTAGVEEQVGLIMPLDSSTYHDTLLAYAMYFETQHDCMLFYIEAYAEIPGYRTIIIKNRATGEVIVEKSFLMIEGQNYLQLDAPLQADQYYEIATDADENMDMLGSLSPRLLHSYDFVDYPFSNSYLTITGSNSEDAEYFYFYNWHVIGEQAICNSPWLPVYAVVDSGSAVSTLPLDADDVRVFPNPSRSEFTVHLEHPNLWSGLQLISPQGQIMMESEVTSQQHIISVDHAGIYFVRLIDKETGGAILRKVVALD